MQILLVSFAFFFFILNNFLKYFTGGSNKIMELSKYTPIMLVLQQVPCVLISPIIMQMSGCRSVKSFKSS